MAIAKDFPFEKLTPEACRIAFPSKLSAPEASLGDVCQPATKVDIDHIHNL
jgi:hypothetical protein